MTGIPPPASGVRVGSNPRTCTAAGTSVRPGITGAYFANTGCNRRDFSASAGKLGEEGSSPQLSRGGRAGGGRRAVPQPELTRCALCVGRRTRGVIEALRFMFAKPSFI